VPFFAARHALGFGRSVDRQTPSRPATRLGYLIASSICFIAGGIGQQVLIHFLLGITLPRYTSGSSIIGTLFLYAPFAALALMAASVERKSSRIGGAVFFGFFVCVLGALYFHGFWYFEIAMMARKWTAASLSIGLLPFQSVPVLVVAGGVALLVRKPRQPPPPGLCSP
jgi:uncharacterized membrane protein (GlpM family)